MPIMFRVRVNMTLAEGWESGFMVILRNHADYSST